MKTTGDSTLNALPTSAIAALTILMATPALAQDIPVRGTSSAERLVLTPGLAVERVARLRMTGAGLRFAETSSTSSYPALDLVSGTCRVRAEDRNRDGIYETVTTRMGDRPAARCPAVETSFQPVVIEAGEEVTALTNCRVATTRDYNIACQPTRFGRDNGEAWTVLEGFADAHGRQSRGRPDDLSWDHGLLILDDTTGVIYRVTDAEFVPAAAQPDVNEPAETAPARPTLLRTSGLSDLPVTAERRKVMDDQERTFAKYRPEKEALPDRYEKARERHRKRQRRGRQGSDANPD